jgi:hypothetical protein
MPHGVRARVNRRPPNGIVSKGLHELTENECVGYFPVVRDGIKFMIEQKAERLEREERMKAASARVKPHSRQLMIRWASASTRPPLTGGSPATRSRLRSRLISPLALRHPDDSCQLSSSPQRVLVVLKRSRCVSETPAASTSGP